MMATLGYLTDVIGPRLTGSPGLTRANEWTRDKLAGWGLENAHLESWAPSGVVSRCNGSRPRWSSRTRFP